jgi:hypothetical protein
MDSYYILALLTSTLIFIITPLLFIGILYLILKTKTTQKLALTICSILLTIFGYLIITNVFPREEFYVDNFKENTQLTMPNSGRLVNYSGNNSIYNFGDYNIFYIYELPTKEYENLYSQLILKEFQRSDKYLETMENDKLINANHSLKIRKILTKEFGFKSFDILFMDDNKTLMFNSNKW